VESTVVTELTEPLIGKQGQVRLLFRGMSGRLTLSDDKHPLTAVRVRPDGHVETSRDDGRDVLDPADVLAVEWVSRDGEGLGQYL
jgi:hypothetical protein